MLSSDRGQRPSVKSSQDIIVVVSSGPSVVVSGPSDVIVVSSIVVSGVSVV